MLRKMGRVVLNGFVGLFVSCAATLHRYMIERKTQAKRYRLDAPPVLEKELTKNELLEKAQKILEGQIIGPESFVVDKEAIYASVSDAKILKIVDGRIVSQVSCSELVRETGKCHKEEICGRPLGMRKLSEDSKKLVVADAYLGVFVVDFTDEQNPTTTQILDSEQPIDGLKPRFLNDLDVLNEDEVIISDSSTKYDRRHFMPLILEHNADGRIIHLKISTNTAKILASGLYFPNGVQLTSDKKSVLVAETSTARILKIDLASREIEIFAENLPGMPDNIRITERNTHWVALAGIRHSAAPSLIDKLGDKPRIRQFLIDIIPVSFWKPLLHAFSKPHTIVVEIDEKGKIIRSLHDLTGKAVKDVSQACEFDGFLYLGSVNNHYLAKVEL